MQNETDGRLILLNPEDNCLIAATSLPQGQTMIIEDERVTLAPSMELAHRVARRALAKDEKVLRYGAAIGHLNADVARGEHLHTHNLESDYIPTYTHDAEHAYVRH